MTKAEFLDQLAGDDRLGSKKAASDAVDAVLDAITDTLSSGGEVSFTGFGKFHVAERGPRQGANPPPGEGGEGFSFFPRPGRAGGHRLRMRRGERVVQGVIKGGAQARRSYGAARRAGQRAGLVEQQRSNIFTASVANIGPGQQVSIRIRYRQVLHYRDGHLSISFPMVVAPRYIPGTPVVGSGQGTGWASPTDQVPDAGRITPPVRPPWPPSWPSSA